MPTTDELRTQALCQQAREEWAHPKCQKCSHRSWTSCPVVCADNPSHPPEPNPDAMLKQITAKQDYLREWAAPWWKEQTEPAQIGLPASHRIDPLESE